MTKGERDDDEEGEGVIVRDEPPYALCERTVQHCIDVLPQPPNIPANADFRNGIKASRAALEALLPKPDPLNALLAEHEQWRTKKLAAGGQVKLDRRECFARWLIEKGAKLP